MENRTSKDSDIFIAEVENKMQEEENLDANRSKLFDSVLRKYAVDEVKKQPIVNSSEAKSNALEDNPNLMLDDIEQFVDELNKDVSEENKDLESEDCNSKHISASNKEQSVVSEEHNSNTESEAHKSSLKQVDNEFNVPAFNFGDVEQFVDELQVDIHENPLVQIEESVKSSISNSESIAENASLRIVKQSQHNTDKGSLNKDVSKENSQIKEDVPNIEVNDMDGLILGDMEQFVNELQDDIPVDQVGDNNSKASSNNQSCLSSQSKASLVESNKLSSSKSSNNIPNTHAKFENKNIQSHNKTNQKEDKKYKVGLEISPSECKTLKKSSKISNKSNKQALEVLHKEQPKLRKPQKKPIKINLYEVRQAELNKKFNLYKEQMGDSNVRVHDRLFAKAMKTSIEKKIENAKQVKAPPLKQSKPSQITEEYQQVVSNPNYRDRIRIALRK